MSPRGTLELIGRLATASNATFLTRDQEGGLWVYKPVTGEAPLWDFPAGTLSRREVAAFELNRELGFDVVPPTLWCDGPLGQGSAQQWIEGEISDLVDVIPPQEVDDAWLPVVMGVDQHGESVVVVHRDDPQLRAICLFDLLINNSDRKGGHLITRQGKVWAVDHGVSLHVDPKVRTVLWGFANAEFTSAEREQIGAAARLQEVMFAGIADAEVAALRARATALLEEGCFPEPTGDWPAIPWPPF